MPIRVKSVINAAGILIVGATLTGLSLFVQLESVDLFRFELKRYLQTDLVSPLWWKVIGVPTLAGVGYIAVSFAFWRRRKTASSDLVLLSGCWIMAGLLALSIRGSGLFAFVVTSILLINELATRIRPQ